MALATQSWQFTLAAGVLIGAAQAGTTYAVVYGVIGRNIAADKRAWAMRRHRGSRIAAQGQHRYAQKTNGQAQPAG